MTLETAVRQELQAGQTLSVEAPDATWRIYDEDGLVTEVARTTTEPAGRFKVHKPEPPRRPQTPGPALPQRGPLP